VRTAIGVGRLALDPLAVIASLFGARRAILSLTMHELQDALPQELLAERLAQVCWAAPGARALCRVAWRGACVCGVVHTALCGRASAGVGTAERHSLRVASRARPNAPHTHSRPRTRAQTQAQTLITAVSQVGVDINAMVANAWRQAPLAFVPGLGPRKARTLLGAIAAAEDPYVRQRTDLLRPVRGLGALL
jgi:transcriptional accessory protein Tex/SPT6